MSKPTVLSLFSGVGGFDLGLERAGFEVVGQCDNDPFCNKVLAKHWPEVLRYDDVRNVGLGPAQRDQQGQPLDTATCQPDTARAGHVDLVCGGFPCQDLSVAGKRAGLDGARSGLWFEFHRVLSELRPVYCLIENVPGLLSACGCDICTAIGLRNRRHTRERELSQSCDCYSCEFGRRVQRHHAGLAFSVVLAGLGQLWPAVGWAVLDSQHFGIPQRRRRVYIVGGPSRASVQQILSLCEGGDWHPQTGRATGEDITPAIDASPDGISGTVSSKWSKGAGGPAGDEHYNLITHSLRAEGFDASEDGTGRGTPLVAIRTANTGANGHGIAEDVAHTLDGANGQAIGYTIHGTDKTQRVASETPIAGSLRTKPPGSQENSSTTVALAGASVRRLTPVECERLQGFPDDWTKLDDKTPDGPRYKACGNAVSVPVIEYIGKRLITLLRGEEKL